MLKQLNNVGESIRRAHKKKVDDQPRLRPTMVAIITKGSQAFFVFSRHSKHWGPVKGEAERGEKTGKSETPEEALWREVREETGWLPEHFSGQFCAISDYLGSKKSLKLSSGKNLGRVLGKYMHCYHLRLKDDAPPPKLSTQEGLTSCRFIESRKAFCQLNFGHRTNHWLLALKAAGVPWAQGKKQSKSTKKRKSN